MLYVCIVKPLEEYTKIFGYLGLFVREALSLFTWYTGIVWISTVTAFFNKVKIYKNIISTSSVIFIHLISLWTRSRIAGDILFLKGISNELYALK